MGPLVMTLWVGKTANVAVEEACQVLNEIEFSSWIDKVQILSNETVIWSVYKVK